MEKTLSAPAVTWKKGTPPVKASDESKEAKLNLKKNQQEENVFDDLGEMDDLYEIYGEMSSQL